MMSRDRWAARQATAAGILLVLAAASSGCSLGGNDADAAPVTRVETFRIQAESLVLVSDSPPSVEVADGATTYRLVAGTDALFTLTGGSGATLRLQSGDVVVERPASGHLTLVRAQ